MYMYVHVQRTMYYYMVNEYMAKDQLTADLPHWLLKLTIMLFGKALKSFFHCF